MIGVRIAHALGAFVLDVDIQIGSGVTAIYGPSGAGKTTLVNAVAGLIRPQVARITVADRVLTDTATGEQVPPHQRRIGYVFQDARLFPHLTVARNLTYGAKGAGGLRDVVDLLGLGALLDRKPDTLSGGEKQRVAIGRALLSAPDLLIMDEPLAALDPARKAEIIPYLSRLRHEAQVPILYVSHAMDEIVQLADHLVLMRQGQAVASGPIDDILSDPKLVPALGVRAAGSVLPGRVTRHADDGLTEVAVAGGVLHLPQRAELDGSALRIRIAAQDVMLSRHRPQDMSALNILEGRISDIHMGDGPGAIVTVDLGGNLLLARVTRRSVEAMSLAKDQPIFAVIKTVAVARGDIGPIGNGVLQDVTLV